MSQRRRLARLHEEEREAWLAQEAERVGVSMEQAYRLDALWRQLFAAYGFREGEAVPTETLEAFLRDVAEIGGAADPEGYVAETIAVWKAEQGR